MNGLVLWSVAGLIAGIASRLLPGPALGWPRSLLTGLGGGLVGGLLATSLGMGGIAELDPRAGTLALLVAALSILFLHLFVAWRR
jgi:uncharacterized membrane protein YeaQ/YmgE (transglycosylase-associated protein family)